MSQKRVGILVEQLYEDLEVWYPKIYFEAKKAKVTVIGLRKQTYRGKNGYPIEPDALVSETVAKDLDALVIPGGFAPDYLRRSKAVLDLVASVHKADKPVAAICHAGWVLISAGLAKGRTLTGYFAIKDDLVNAGASYVDNPVVVDGKLITSRKPADLPFFCAAIADMLEIDQTFGI